MNKRYNREAGSAHLVIIIILVLVALGLLGFVFWNNFMRSDTTQETAETTEVQASEEVAFSEY